MMRKFVLAAVLVLMASGAQAATLDVIGGQLHGASGILVDGSLYDVQFLDGTCIDLFNGCDDVSDFTFQTQASAVLASQALLDQVFLDGVGGLFDSDPHLTNGCEPSVPYCLALTPFSFPMLNPSGDVGTYVAVNGDNPPSAACAGFCRGPRSFDLLFLSTHTYNVWSATVVPEPSTAILLGLGLTGLAGKGRRRSRS
jgi:hypothetical protein